MSRKTIVVNRYPQELERLARKRGAYPTVRYGWVSEYEMTVDDIELLWGEDGWGCQCRYYLILINGKVYKYCSGCGWDKAWIARFDTVEEYLELCKRHKVSERWLTRTPALK